MDNASGATVGSSGELGATIGGGGELGVTIGGSWESGATIGGGGELGVTIGGSWESGVAVSGSGQSGAFVEADNGLARLRIDLEKGEFAWSCGERFAWTDIRGAFRWQGREYDTAMYDRHALKEEPRDIADGFGQGKQVTVVHDKAGLPGIEQHFYVYEQTPFFLMRTIVVGEPTMKLNRIVALRSAKLHWGQEADDAHREAEELRVLRIPYDNDKWVRYTAAALPLDLESYEATALFRPGSRRGFVLGSVSHDVWKTGISVKAERIDKLNGLELYAGAAGEMTRDTLPHGYVKGARIEAPLVFAGYYDDYRDGLEAYGRANALVEAPLRWEGGVPFGWNSWSAAMSTLDYELYTSTSDFLAAEAQPLGFKNEETLYINFDAFWNRLSAEEMEDALRRVRRNGHKPGTYWTPFAFWGSPAQFAQSVEGTDGKYTYADILLRDHEGEIVADIAGGLAIDPTHPGSLQRIDWFTGKMIADGFEYIKLDFMAHGALEGKHYAPDVTTGIAAYRYGLSYLAAKLSPEAAGRPIFVNLSIAPLFPYAFAHSRRISCDVFGRIGDTEYLLNSLAYGWWMNDCLYRFNDPDHTVLYKSFNQETTGWQEGRSRLTASVISGTVLLLGDDFRKEEAAERAKAWLSNRAVMDVARLGRTFRPIEAGVGDKAPDAFALLEPAGERGASGAAAYVAVFNFDAKAGTRKTVSLERLGLDGGKRYAAADLWEGTERVVAGELAAELEPAEAKLYRISEL
ncbi:alpha-galactosidase [Cohnella cellulosilytica]|uniref:Alpha-galactosidase n=1 Tax=Cohnella cellulosilytica TaxID=986710 RepID=A0ABW2FHH4_9BACL